MYKATIGLEVHAELKTKSKMFCACKNEPHAAVANTHICPVCLAHPGTLPVPNRTAIKYVLTFGAAVGAKLADFSEFDRKNYFYPDIPKAYQISQYAYPLVESGEIAGVELTRVHLEEDTARSQHDKGAGSLVDYNRAGVPLMELVTEPVIHDAETAVGFAKELQLLLRTLGISDANMEKGEMRVEANISVSDTEELGTKVEVKNLNSFKVVEQAINYEIERQTALIKEGGQVSAETRGWDESKSKTFSQRSKETAKDYRYFPDPDIPKLKLSEISDMQGTSLADIIPELPAKKREKYSDIGLSSQQVETIVQSREIDSYFSELYRILEGDKEILKTSTNYLLTDMVPLWAGVMETGERLSPQNFAALMKLVKERKITSRVAKDLIIKYALKNEDLLAVVEREGLSSSLDEAALTSMVSEIITQHKDVVEEYKAGKEAALMFLLGQLMKQTKGSADPAASKNIFIVEIDKTR